MSDRYAVIGNPIAHSKSPRIHAAFAEQLGEDLEYGRILGDRQNFSGDVQRFFAHAGRGLNVTVPFKEEAWRLAEVRSERAEIAGAVNTLTLREDGRVHGDNTDGAGLVRDLTHNQGFEFAAQRVLLLGAGGAARGVLLPVLEAAPQRLVIANRTVEKARRLAELGASHGPSEARGLDQLAGEQFDLIINATSAGLADQVPEIPDDLLAPGGWVYDMLYAEVPTPFCRWGHAHGAAQVLDGLGMLIEQAAESYRIWRGQRPDTAPVMAMLRGSGG